MRAVLALVLALVFAPQIASAATDVAPKTASGVFDKISQARIRVDASQLAQTHQENACSYGGSASGIVIDPINNRDPTGRILDVLLVGALYGPEAAAGYLARVAQYGASAAVDAARAVCVPCQLLGNPISIRPETELDKDLAAGAAGRLEASNPLNQVARSIAAAQETSGFEKGEHIANAGNAAVDAVLLAVGGARLLYSGAAALSSRFGARPLSLNPEAGRLSLPEVNARPPITDPARLLPARAESLTAAGGASRIFPGGVDDVIASAAGPSRAGSTTSRALQALQKKLDNPLKAGAFKGLPKTQAQAEVIIREAFGARNPIFRTGSNRAGQAVIDVFDPSTGRGVRLLEATGEFDTFVNLF